MSLFAVELEYWVISPDATALRLVIDVFFRVGVGVVLLFIAGKLISVQEAARNNSIRSTLKLLQRLAVASEFRDDITASHNNRIGGYCAVIGQTLGLNMEQAEMLRYASTLHDIGKVAIPDHILKKPGPLTRNERDQIEQHVMFGANLLSDHGHPIMNCAYNIALTHHEAWDGSGYPYGLSHQDIPLEGRIVALCDTFDALVSKRPYKEAWTFEEATIEILRHSGKRFDPVVVNSFVRALATFRSIDQPTINLPDASETGTVAPWDGSLTLPGAHWTDEAIAEAHRLNQVALDEMMMQSGLQVRA